MQRTARPELLRINNDASSHVPPNLLRTGLSNLPADSRILRFACPGHNAFASRSGESVKGQIKWGSGRPTPVQARNRTSPVLELHSSGECVDQDLGDCFRFADRARSDMSSIVSATAICSHALRTQLEYPP